MTAEERELRERLDELAATDDGRRLLQLALRGIDRGEQELTAGCWTQHGVAGCLFQHAYWQGVREGVFADKGRPGDWIGSLVGSGGYGMVIDAIGAFDRLAKREHADRIGRPLLPDRLVIRTGEWREAVGRMLVEALAAPAPASPVRNSAHASAV
jgi:hypothetical protein